MVVAIIHEGIVLIGLVGGYRKSVNVKYHSQTVTQGGQLTLALEVVQRRLLRNEIPDRWRRLAPGTSKTLARWMEQLKASLEYC